MKIPQRKKTVNHVDVATMISRIEKLPLAEKIDAINQVKKELHKISPFNSEPVDCVLWVNSEIVHANDYNPNSVAPPEMELLKVSILEDGYTQPIVTFKNEGKNEVVDGFHRNRVGKECDEVKKRIHGYLPVVQINTEKSDKGDRIASTIRHNRARGKHKITAMSEIVIELKRRNWKTERICRELGMDEDEVLRLLQITGLQEMFSNQEFSKSWEADGEVVESDFKELTDNVETYGEEAEEFRTVNTSDENRIFHTYEKWECWKAGFYNSSKSGVTKDEAQELYREFLADLSRFRAGLEIVISQWKNSCEHYLTNEAMNRIAWLGQAAACAAINLPAEFCGGFNLLTQEQQIAANQLALEYLNKWLVANGRKEVEMNQAAPGRESTIY
jgi:ParB-like chromosome segregation protein Spo0J